MEKRYFSINGPPGTGKTTLLKEIVVSNVIERAKLLVEFDKPDQAFSIAEFKNPCDQYNRSYYCMDKRLKNMEFWLPQIIMRRLKTFL